MAFSREGGETLMLILPANLLGEYFTTSSWILRAVRSFSTFLKLVIDRHLILSEFFSTARKLAPREWAFSQKSSPIAWRSD
jgi:hypothetical protein